MLYFLGFSIFMCLLVPALLFADEQGIDFFKERVNPAQEKECSACSNTMEAIKPELKKKTEEVERMIKGNFAREHSQLENEIILFVDPSYGSSEQAVKKLAKFKKDNSGWSVKAIIVTSPTGLKDKLLKRREWFREDIEFSVDLTGSLVSKFGVTDMPSFIVNYQGASHKIPGHANLKDAISKLDK